MAKGVKLRAEAEARAGDCRALAAAIRGRIDARTGIRHRSERAALEGYEAQLLKIAESLTMAAADCDDKVLRRFLRGTVVALSITANFFTVGPGIGPAADFMGEIPNTIAEAADALQHGTADTLRKLEGRASEADPETDGYGGGSGSGAGNGDGTGSGAPMDSEPVTNLEKDAYLVSEGEQIRVHLGEIAEALADHEDAPTPRPLVRPLADVAELPALLPYLRDRLEEMASRDRGRNYSAELNTILKQLDALEAEVAR